MDNDGFVSNGELFQVLKMMVGNNLKDSQLQQIVDKTIIMYDKVSGIWDGTILHIHHLPQENKNKIKKPDEDIFTPKVPHPFKDPPKEVQGQLLRFWDESEKREEPENEEKSKG